MPKLTDNRHETVDWLPRTKVRGRSGDFLVVALSSAVFIMLGLAAMIVRFGPADPASSAYLPGRAAVAAPQQRLAANPAPTLVNPALTPTTTPAKPKFAQSEPVRSQNEAPDLKETPVPREASGHNERRSLSVGSNPTASSMPASSAPTLPADALAPGPVAREPAIVAAAPIASQPVDLAFAPDPPPAAPIVDGPAIVDELARVPEPPVRAVSRPQIAKAEAPPPEAVLRKGGEGATWAAYFDSFPDQRAAAAQINSLQSKYGPHLGGRRLTYTRKGETWLMRASGLTQESADQVCEKVRKTGSPCSVGAK